MPRRNVSQARDPYGEDESYDRYDEEYAEYDEEYEDDRPARRARQSEPLARQALDWGISGSILAILVLTAIYAFFPIDAIPDFIPFAGQADDIGAILAGGGSVTFLTVLRYVLRTRIGRWGCLITIVLVAVGAFTVFWALLRLFDAVL
ncbi:MAG: YkvA family protein [Anaerolineae bacterium]|nr:YkvA family protein [Anaerolineae bacterium]